jgi:hypothetical protein
MVPQTMADKRDRDAEEFFGEYLEPRISNEGLSNGRVEFLSDICRGNTPFIRDHGEVLMYNGRILDRDKMKLVKKTIPIVSWVCSNEGFKGAHPRIKFKCWAILGPVTARGRHTAGAYGCTLCPVSDQQWRVMLDDVATMQESKPEILRSRRAFADWLVGLLLAFEIQQAEYVRRTKEFIKAWNDFEADSQDESDVEEPSFDEDGEDVPDPADPDSGLPFINMRYHGQKHMRRVFLWNSRVRKDTRERRSSAPAARSGFSGG